MTNSVQGASPSLAKIKQAIARASITQWTGDDGHEMLEGYLDDIAGAVLAAFDWPDDARKNSK